MALGRAIAWFTRNNFTVCIPLTESQNFDLIVLAKRSSSPRLVEVKYTSYKRYDSFVVSIKSTNLTTHGTAVRNFESSENKDLFVLTSARNIYLIPSLKIAGKTSLNLNNKYDKYIKKANQTGF